MSTSGWRTVVRPPRRTTWRSWVPNVLLFAATAFSVYEVGSRQGSGVRLVLALMGILLAHEMGHYVACRLYRVDATLPYFIPFPMLSLSGTLGAFIAIRSPFPHRRALFDIGAAGPLAGFLVCLPVLYLGIREGTVHPAAAATGPGFLSFGEPLLFQWAAEWVRGPLPDGSVFLIGPLGMAAWFGLLVTALNLMPIGQLDGGHVAYAVLRGRSRWIARAAMLGTLGLLWLRPTWLLWTILLVVLRRPHPPPSTMRARSAPCASRWPSPAPACSRCRSRPPRSRSRGATSSTPSAS